MWQQPKNRDATLDPLHKVQLPWACPTCGTAIGGAAIGIRAGLIKDIWVFCPDELASEAYYLIQPDRSRLRMQEWENRRPKEDDYSKP